MSDRHARPREMKVWIENPLHEPQAALLAGTAGRVERKLVGDAAEIGSKGGGADEPLVVDPVQCDGTVMAVTGDAPLLHEQDETGLGVAVRGNVAYRHRLALPVEQCRTFDE